MTKDSKAKYYECHLYSGQENGTISLHMTYTQSQLKSINRFRREATGGQTELFLFSLTFPLFWLSSLVVLVPLPMVGLIPTKHLKSQITYSLFKRCTHSCSTREHIFRVTRDGSTSSRKLPLYEFQSVTDVLLVHQI